MGAAAVSPPSELDKTKVRPPRPAREHACSLMTKDAQEGSLCRGERGRPSFCLLTRNTDDGNLQLLESPGGVQCSATEGTGAGQRWAHSWQ